MVTRFLVADETTRVVNVEVVFKELEVDHLQNHHIWNNEMLSRVERI